MKAKFLVKLILIVTIIVISIFTISVVNVYVNNYKECNEYIALNDLKMARSLSHYVLNDKLIVNGTEIVPVKELTDNELSKQLKIHKAIYSDSLMSRIKLSHCNGFISVRKGDLPEGHPDRVSKLTVSQAIDSVLKK